MLTISFQNQLLQNLQLLPKQKNKEEVTLAKIIDPIIELSGFDSMNIMSVEEEYDASIGGLHPIEIDKCLKKDGKPIAFMQSKQIGSSYRFKSDYERTFKAALLQQIPWVIFTDGESWEFHKLNGIQYERITAITLRYDQSQYLVIVTILKNIKGDTWT